MPILALALIPPALFAVSNYLDKYLLEKYFQYQGNGALIIFSSLIGLVAMPVVWFFDHTVFELTFSTAALITVNGMLYVLALLPYFSAMREDEASIVAPLFQLIPVIGYVLGYFILGESLGIGQIAAGLVVVIGAFALSLDVDSDRLSVKWRPFLLMTLSSFLMALNSVVFKLFALDASYSVTLFWDYAGLGVVGIGLLLFAPTARRQFIGVMRRNSGTALGLNTLNEVVNVCGMAVLNFALLLAPVAFIFLAGATQPLFILAYGVILTLLFPKYIEERLDKKALVQKAVAIAILVIGALLLDLAS